MKNSIAQFLPGFAVLCVALSMCSDHTVLPSHPSSPLTRPIYVNDEAIKFNGQFLEFATSAVFDSTVATLRNASPSAILAWNDHYGLTSMRRILENALTEQENYLSRLLAEYQQSPSNDRRDIHPVLQRQPLAVQYESLLKFDNEGLISGLREFHIDIAGLINKDGLVKVAGNILQFNENDIKVIEGGDVSKIALLSRTSETDERVGIVVKPVVSALTGKATNGRMSYNGSCSASQTSVFTVYTMKGTSSLSFYSTPIYGPQVCECSGGGTAPGAKQLPVCNCYDPIIGYNTRTVYTGHGEARKSLIGISAADQGGAPAISFRWELVNDVHVYSAYTWAPGLSNVYLTAYDGPAINVQWGGHTYSNDELMNDNTMLKIVTWDNFAD